MGVFRYTWQAMSNLLEPGRTAKLSPYSSDLCACLTNSFRLSNECRCGEGWRGWPRLWRTTEVLGEGFTYLTNPRWSKSSRILALLLSFRMPWSWLRSTPKSSRPSIVIGSRNSRVLDEKHRRGVHRMRILCNGDPKNKPTRVKNSND